MPMQGRKKEGVEEEMTGANLDKRDSLTINRRKDITTCIYYAIINTPHSGFEISI